MIDLRAEMIRLSGLIEEALTELRQRVEEYADAEHAYREARAMAWIAVPSGTVAQREAWIDGDTVDKRRDRDLADGLRQAALEAVRSRRAQLSALQTISNAEREEMAFSRTGPS